MKKLLFIYSIFLCSALNAQEMPYAKFFNMTSNELKTNKFKYDTAKNQYTLKKIRGWMKPKQDDYQIIIQNAKDNISYVEIIFYNDQTYHELVRWAKTNGENQIETTTGDLNKLSFNFGEYYIVLTNINTSFTITHKYSSTWSNGLEYSYNTYAYSIYTGKEPYSKWHQKKEKKESKHTTKNKKKSEVSEFM